MSATTIWHNPRCSKSRQTLALLIENGIQPEIVEYLKQPPDAPALRRALELLNIEPSQLVRKSEAAYKELGLSGASNGEDIVVAMANHPVLIERPIVFHNGKAAIGRPPEKVLELF